MPNFLKSRLVISGLLVMVIVGLFGGGFALGVNYGERFPKTLLIHGVSNLENGKPRSADFSIFWQAWNEIDQTYLNSKDVPVQGKIYGAIKGLVSSLGDPYSEFFTPSENTNFREEIGGNFGGIGAELGVRESRITIISPLPETPAERAGLRAGDIILMVNGTSTEGMSTEEAVRLIRGEVQTPVTLTVIRKEWEKPKEIKIVREIIQIPTVHFEMKEDVAVIKLYHFNALATGLFYQAGQKVLDNHARGIVLDLRNDPGGYLDTAVDIASAFLKQNTLVVREEGRDNESREFRSRGKGQLGALPIVILVNGGSASASEILAGTLRDNLGVKLVGEKTFGKGTVQQVIDLPDASSIKITVAHWILPKGQLIEKIGLVPDIEIKPAEGGNIDVQLEKAIEVLRKEISS